MKSISRRIRGVLVGLGVLGLIVPIVRADETAEAEMQRRNDEYHRQEWDEWMNNHWGHLPLGELEITAPQAVALRSPARSSAVVILNPFALEKMAPQDQKRVRNEATQTGLPIVQERAASQQIIHNPFVRLPSM